MKNKILDFLIENIKKNYNYNETKLKEIRYGLESLYLSIFKFIIIIILSIFIHTLKEVCLLFVFYSILRLTGFGLHAKKSWQCWITTLPVFVIIPYLIKTITINKYCILLICLFSLIIYIIYAPADTEKRPITNIKKRKIYKLLTITICITYTIVILIVNNKLITNTIAFSLLLESILILPITYRLFDLNYNNYKLYIGKEDKK